MASKSATIFYGRMNPPTVEGHGKGIQKVLDYAENTGSTPYVFVSHSHDNKKNPVSPQTKVAAIKHSFPDANVQATTKESPTILHIAKNLNKSHSELHVFAGSDRVEEYHNLLHKYNGKDYNYKKIMVHSIGQRDPDGESEEGSITSGTAARKAAMSDPKKFHGGVLGSRQHHDDMIQQIRQAAMSKTNKSLREQFINNEIFNLHDFVINKNGKYGEIVYKNSNYVTIQLENNETIKSWVYEIQETPYRPIRNGTQQQVKETPNQKYIFNYTKKSFDKNIPALLRPTNALLEESNKLIFGDYTTKNYDICPLAYKHMKQVIARKDLNPKYVKQALMALDKMFAIERLAMDNRNVSNEQIHDFTMYASIAHDTLNMLGYPDKDLKYIQDHYIRFGKLIGHHDASLADEPESHVVSSHLGDIDEWADQDQGRFVQQGRAGPGMFKKITTADYETRIGPGGKQYKVKKSIISKGHKLIDKDGKDNEPSGPPPFAGFSGMYEENMEDITNKIKPGVLPFGEFLKVQKQTGVETPPLSGSKEPPPENADVTVKSKHAKTAAKIIQMGLD